MEVKRHYASDLADRQWQIIRPYVPPLRRRGRPPICRRRIVNAILYVVRTGCQWRMLPSDFPNWNTVYGVFWQWRNEGLWQALHDALREKTRRRAGKKSTPTFGWILQTILRPVGLKRFVVLPKRWIVERTFAWLARYRRHSRDYEKTTASSEAFTYVAMITLMSKRLARTEK